MKPVKIALFFFALILFMVAFAYFNHTTSLSFGQIKILLPTRNHLFHATNTSSIPNFLNQQQTIQAVPSAQEVVAPQISRDTIKSITDTLIQESAHKNKANSQTKQPKEISPKDVTLAYKADSLHPHPLKGFYARLQNSSSQQVRIMHYGDSQIEGDRITSYLRNQFQQRFGGGGLGLIPIKLTPGTHTSVKHQLSGHWQRYTIHDLRKQNIAHNRLGILFSYTAFANEKHTQTPASITLKPSPIAYKRIQNYQRIRLFLGHCQAPVVFRVACNDTTLDADLLSASQTIQELSWSLPSSPEQLKFQFTASISPEFYGISMESNTGIIVDNIPLRGSSGTDFTRVDEATQKKLYNALQTDLILLQFGVNLVPYLDSHFSHYKKNLLQQLRRIQKVAPRAAIIIIGVSDMAHKQEGVYQSYKNIDAIRKVQKEAALEAGCVFWDTYKAMGGENAMIKWVAHKPPLGRKDYTHFSYEGATLVAKLFYESLIKDYEQYLENNEN